MKREVSTGTLEIWARASPSTYPNYIELYTDAIYPIPQLHGVNFDYLRPPRLNAGVFEAPHLKDVYTIPSNPSPVLATQHAAQFLAQGRMFHVDLGSPVPSCRGRSAAPQPARNREQLSPEPTPGAAAPNQVYFWFGAVLFLFFDCPNTQTDMRTSDPADCLARAKQARFAKAKPPRVRHSEAGEKASRQLRADRLCEDYLSFFSDQDLAPGEILSVRRI